METEGTTNQGAYRDTLEDLNSIDFNINKATNETNSPNILFINFHNTLLLLPTFNHSRDEYASSNEPLALDYVQMFCHT